MSECYHCGIDMHTANPACKYPGNHPKPPAEGAPRQAINWQERTVAAERRVAELEARLAEADALIFEHHSSRGQWHSSTVQGQAIARHRARKAKAETKGEGK